MQILTRQIAERQIVMPDESEDQQGVSAFTDEWTLAYMAQESPPPEQAIRQVAQQAREEIEKLAKRRSLKIQDLYRLRREEKEAIINRTLGDDVTRIQYFSRLIEGADPSVEGMEEAIQLYERQKAEDAHFYKEALEETENAYDWQKRVVSVAWQDPYDRIYDGDDWDWSTSLAFEQERIGKILESNGLTKEDIERQNRLRDMEPEP